MTPSGRNVLRMVAVPADRPGVTITLLPSLGMVPEMPHAKGLPRSRFPAGGTALWPGDGYTGAIKPFRTHGGFARHRGLSGLDLCGRTPLRLGPLRYWKPCWRLMVAVRGLALASPREPHVHIVLGGLLAQVHDLLEKIDPLWQGVDARVREWWQRDRNVLDIAASARLRRMDAARSHYRCA